MKITVICDVLGEENNGATHAGMNFINSLQKKGHDVTIVCPDKFREGQENYYVCPARSFGPLNGYVKKVGVTIAKADDDIIEEAKEFLSENKNEFIAKTLTGILRFYSDEKIENSLQALIPDFQKAQDFLKGYQELKQYREESLSDEESLKKLRSKRNAWERSVEDSIQYLTQLEPTPGQAKQH